jgi:hypothetical protein
LKASAENVRDAAALLKAGKPLTDPIREALWFRKTEMVSLETFAP